MKCRAARPEGAGEGGRGGERRRSRSRDRGDDRRGGAGGAPPPGAPPAGAYGSGGYGAYGGGAYGGYGDSRGGYYPPPPPYYGYGGYAPPPPGYGPPPPGGDIVSVRWEFEVGMRAGILVMFSAPFLRSHGTYLLLSFFAFHLPFLPLPYPLHRSPFLPHNTVRLLRPASPTTVRGRGVWQQRPSSLKVLAWIGAQYTVLGRV